MKKKKITDIVYLELDLASTEEKELIEFVKKLEAGGVKDVNYNKRFDNNLGAYNFYVTTTRNYLIKNGLGQALDTDYRLDPDNPVDIELIRRDFPKYNLTEANSKYNGRTLRDEIRRNI
jgi:hypothetical protein